VNLNTASALVYVSEELLSTNNNLALTSSLNNRGIVVAKNDVEEMVSFLSKEIASIKESLEFWISGGQAELTWVQVIWDQKTRTIEWDAIKSSMLIPNKGYWNKTVKETRLIRALKIKQRSHKTWVQQGLDAQDLVVIQEKLANQILTSKEYDNMKQKGRNKWQQMIEND